MMKMCAIFVVLAAGCGGGDVMVENPGATPGVCTAVGCAPMLLRSATLALTVEQIRDSTITVCRNRECFSGSFATWEPPSAPGGATGVSFPPPASGSPSITAFVRDLPDGGVRLEIMYGAPQSTFVDGDVFDVTMTASDGTTRYEAHKAVTYVVSYPNGKECGPECHSAYETL